MKSVIHPWITQWLAVFCIILSSCASDFTPSPDVKSLRSTALHQTAISTAPSVMLNSTGTIEPVEITLIPEDNPFDTLIGELAFSDGLDAQYMPLKPGRVFQNPIDHLYALFSYKNMPLGAEWAAIWYRNGEEVYRKSTSWNQAASGLGFSDWQPDPTEWLPGTYRVEILVGDILKAEGTFIVEGLPATVTVTPEVPTSLPTLTPFPTLSPDDAKQLVDQLRDDPNCRLPCWLGITPGVTQWDEARQLLMSFVSIEEVIDPIVSNASNYEAIYDTIDSKSVSDGLGMRLFIRDDQISLISVGPRNADIDLRRLLADYGKPDRVYLWTSSEPMGDPQSITSFLTILVYTEQRILARYYTLASRQGDLILACSPFTNPLIYLWADGIMWNDEPIKGDLGFDAEPIFRPQLLQDVTNMSLDEFFEAFQLRDNACLETVKYLWH